MGRTPNSRKPLDVRDRSAALWPDPAERLEWRVRLVASDKRIQETVLVTAPDFDAAERTASSFARFNEGKAERYVVERLQECPEPGCKTTLVSHDPRTATGGPTMEDVLTEERRCTLHMRGAK